MKNFLKVARDKSYKLFSNFWFFYGLMFLLFMALNFPYSGLKSLLLGTAVPLLSKVYFIIFSFINIVLLYFVQKEKKLSIWRLLLILLSPFLYIRFINVGINYFWDISWLGIFWEFIMILLITWYVLIGRIKNTLFICFVIFLMFFVPVKTLPYFSYFELSNPIYPENPIDKDMRSFAGMMWQFHNDYGYYTEEKDGACLNSKEGTGKLMKHYLQNQSFPLNYENGRNEYFCYEEKPIWYMPWKQKKVGTGEYWYKSLSYKGVENQAFLLCTGSLSSGSMNAKQGVEYTQSYEEAAQYMEGDASDLYIFPRQDKIWMEEYRNPELGTYRPSKESSTLMEDYKRNTHIYIYCLLRK
jgi:hypothetical protein